jgi:hypothetical protein
MQLVDDEGMVAVAYMDDIMIATKGSLKKPPTQDRMVLQLFMDNNMCIEVDNCVFDISETRCYGGINLRFNKTFIN